MLLVRCGHGVRGEGRSALSALSVGREVILARLELPAATLGAPLWKQGAEREVLFWGHAIARGSCGKTVV